jgi:hypothetical protein
VGVVCDADFTSPPCGNLVERTVENPPNKKSQHLPVHSVQRQTWPLDCLGFRLGLVALSPISLADVERNATIASFYS